MDSLQLFCHLLQKWKENLFFSFFSFFSSRRDRHAKTLDIAQEEVLTCLGIHLHERMYRIWRELKAEEQTWQILFYLGINALKKGFEVRTDFL